MNEEPIVKQPKANPIRKIVRWADTHRPQALIIIGLLLIAIALGIAFSIYNSIEVPVVKSSTKKITPPPPTYYSPLTGIKVDSEEKTKQPVTAIMIENSPDARPQSGIKDAGVVYEAVAEGGITRFLAIYQESKPQLIGPVRSLRMYYLDWAAPYNASIAHIGGSLYALQEVRNGNYRDIDQFFNAGTYWRASDRYAPHNVYTNFENIDALNTAKGYTTSEFKGFERQDAKASAEPNATSVDIIISSAWYNTHYDWDATTNTYKRSLGGEAHMDREAGQVTPTVVIAMFVDMTKVMEDGWREQITTSGSGRATVFQNGTATEATWRKNDRMSPLQIIDGEGKPIKLNRGQTWISAVPNGTGSATWQ